MTRVLLLADMEGISQIDDYRECWPIYPEYWNTGRPKMIADINAAVLGLLDGGATEVGLINGHGFGYPNILEADLVDGCVLISDEDVNTVMQTGGYDATLQVGRHARCGTKHGFMSHTQAPDFRVSIDGKLVTESHINAWRTNLPLLGVIGDAALEPELDHSLAGTPFMAVKHADSRVDVSPIHTDPDESAAAIRAFATWCLENAGKRAAPVLPDRFIFSCCLNGALAELAIDRHGLLRTSPSVLVKSSTDWWSETEPALQAAMAAAVQPWLAAWRGIEYSSLETLEAQNPDRLERARRFIHDWMHRNEADWKR